MREHFTKSDIQRFRNNELQPAELLELDDHLSGCEDCRKRLVQGTGPWQAAASIGGLLSAPDHARSVSHLNYHEFEGYVDDTLDAPGRKTAETHLQICEECVNEVAGLKALARPEHRIHSTYRRSVLDFLKFRNLRPWMSFAVPAVVIVSLASAIWLWSALSRAPREQNVTATETQDNNPPGQDSVPFPETPPSHDDSLTRSPETKLVVSLIEAGREIGLTTTGQLSGYDAVDSHYRELIGNSLRAEKIVIGQAARDLRSGKLSTMGANDPDKPSFHLNGPVGKVILSNRPKFSWQSLPEAESYVVDIYDKNYNKIATSGQIRTTEWSTAIERGQTYLWQVTAVKDGEAIVAPRRPEPEAKFTVLDRQKAGELERLRRRFPRSNLLLGIAYAEAGLVDDAAREFEKLAKQNPQSKIAIKFLTQIR